jgi:putative transposase
VDFTHVAAWAGTVYVAFVVDTFSRRIVGWSAAMSKETQLVLDAVGMGIWQCDRDGHPHAPGKLIHHSDAGSRLGFTESSHRGHGGEPRSRDRSAGGRPVGGAMA